jgi:glycerol-3-phosphate dehydrogenase
VADSQPPLPSRAQHWRSLEGTQFDVLIVGAGINGAVTAAALAAKGVRVALIDQGDFANQTSMHSSNLAWGGIKYMENLEFRLVRKLCVARNALMRAYPTAVRETRFLTTVPRGFRWPRWFLYVGAWLYWIIGSFFTKPPRLLSRRQLHAEQPLINVEASVGGFEYSDAHLVDGDARFVFGFVRGAVEHGAVALNYAKAENTTFDGTSWAIDVVDQTPSSSQADGAGVFTRKVTVKASVLINACGPYADKLNASAGIDTGYQHVLSKGVHLNVRRIAEGDRVLAFFASDGRLFFAIPLGSRSCIGTTDTRTLELPPQTTDEDRRVILDNINAKLRLEHPLTRADILAERCGVRPLVVAKAAKTAGGDTDWTALSRKHIVEVTTDKRHITIFGGKLTDCLNVGDELVEAVATLGVAVSAEQPRWYGEGTPAERSAWMNTAKGHIADGTAERLWRCYGVRAHSIVELIRHDASLGLPLYPEIDVLRAEAAYAGRYEYVETAEDFLRRRTHVAQQLSQSALFGGDGYSATVNLLFRDRTQNQDRV